MVSLIRFKLVALQMVRDQKACAGRGRGKVMVYLLPAEACRVLFCESTLVWKYMTWLGGSAPITF